jgi:hypothetical protein
MEQRISPLITEERVSIQVNVSHEPFACLWVFDSLQSGRGKGNNIATHFKCGNQSMTAHDRRESRHGDSHGQRRFLLEHLVQHDKTRGAALSDANNASMVLKSHHNNTESREGRRT